MLVEMEVADIVAAASRVENNVKLDGLRLTESRSRSRKPPNTAQLATGLTINVTARSNSEKVLADVHYAVQAHDPDNKDTEPYWEVECRYVIEYDAIAGATFADQDLEAFGIISTTLTIHPYARVLIHQMTAMMGYPPFDLPLLTSRDLTQMAHAVDAAEEKVRNQN